MPGYFDTEVPTDVIHDLRTATERPVGKLTYEIKDQRLFDSALDRLFEAANIDPLGA